MHYILHHVHYFTDSLFSKHVFASSLKLQKSKNATYYNLYEFSHVLLALWWYLPVCVPATVVLRSVRHKLLALLFWHLDENPQQTCSKWYNIWTKVQHSQMYSDSHSPLTKLECYSQLRDSGLLRCYTAMFCEWFHTFCLHLQIFSGSRFMKTNLASDTALYCRKP